MSSNQSGDKIRPAIVERFKTIDKGLGYER